MRDEASKAGFECVAALTKLLFLSLHSFRNVHYYVEYLNDGCQKKNNTCHYMRFPELFWVHDSSGKTAAFKPPFDIYWIFMEHLF